MPNQLTRYSVSAGSFKPGSATLHSPSNPTSRATSSKCAMAMPVSTVCMPFAWYFFLTMRMWKWKTSSGPLTTRHGWVFPEEGDSRTISRGFSYFPASALDSGRSKVRSKKKCSHPFLLSALIKARVTFSPSLGSLGTPTTTMVGVSPSPETSGKYSSLKYPIQQVPRPSSVALRTRCSST